MPVEIERKFLIRNTDFIEGLEAIEVIQAYLALPPENTVRVRIAAEKAYLTIKGKTKGFSRPEYEYEIPLNHAREMIKNLCVFHPITKTRYFFNYQGFKWEIDIFHGDNQGLVIAECELNSENIELPLPSWIKEEVTGDLRYYNSYLTKKPFNTWE